MKNKITAVEYLVEKLNQCEPFYSGVSSLNHKHYIDELIEQAKKIEREQHGNTWDAAIKAHDDRGHVYVRSICDFDDYEVGSYSCR